MKEYKLKENVKNVLHPWIEPKPTSSRVADKPLSYHLISVSLKEFIPLSDYMSLLCA